MEKPADDSENLREEVARLRERVEYLEDQLAKSQLQLAREFFANRPLPYTEDELKQMVDEEQGLPLEDFIEELHQAAQGKDP